MTGQKRLVIHYWDHVKVFVRLFRANLTLCTILMDFVYCEEGSKINLLVSQIQLVLDTSVFKLKLKRLPINFKLYLTGFLWTYLIVFEPNCLVLRLANNPILIIPNETSLGGLVGRGSLHKKCHLPEVV